MAKTQTTTTPPDSPAVPQTEPMADQDDELTSNDTHETVTTSGFDDQAAQNERSTTEDVESDTDDDQEVVEAVTAMNSNDANEDRESESNDTLDAVTNAGFVALNDVRENAAHQEVVTSEGFKYLKVAWDSATDEDRFAFLTWVKTDADQKRWHEAVAPVLQSLNSIWQ
jgi:hypothetical protein